MPHLFDTFTQKSMTLKNRLVMAPMCMYSAVDGVPNEFHFAHLGARALGGVSLVIAEATSVEAVGRISEGDLGLWNDEQEAAFKRIAAFVHKQGAKFGIQLGHAGRKAYGSSSLDPYLEGEQPKGRGPQTPVGPSALAWGEGWVTPEELDHAGIDRIVNAFGASAARAAAAGCDMIELHAAHGYLGHQFLSPIANQRKDEYGGSFANRIRFLKRVVEAVKATWPEDRPFWVRLSVTDWVEGGWDIDESVELSRQMKEWGVDLVDVSSGGNSPAQQIKVGPGYQVPFAERIRREAGVPTGAVGMITTAAQANEIVESGKADLVLMARELLRNPFFPLAAAHELGHDVTWPVQYERGKFQKTVHAGQR